MRNIKNTDLNGFTAHISANALIKVAQIALGKAHNDAREHLHLIQESQFTGIMPCKIERLKWDIEAIQLANEVLYALKEANNTEKNPAGRKLDIVRDDVVIPEGYKLIGQYDKVEKGDLIFFAGESTGWAKAFDNIGQYSGDMIVIRPV